MQTDFRNQSPASIGSHDTTQETPSSSTAISSAPGGSSVADELAKGYRWVLHFFMFKKIEKIYLKLENLWNNFEKSDKQTDR